MYLLSITWAVERYRPQQAFMPTLPTMLYTRSLLSLNWRERN
ncbi:hypothetical protein [Nostoc sphaeroides]|nr:hypothetical protein [Nostoc sphaeroides]